MLNKPDLLPDMFEGQYVGKDSVVIYEEDKQVVYVVKDGEIYPPPVEDKEKKS